MTMACMHTFSRLTATRCGGTGDGTGALPDQVGAGDGILHGIIVGTLHGILLTGTVATGVAIGEVTGVVIGAPDGITITRIMDGEEVLIKDIPIPTITVVQSRWYGEVPWVLCLTVTAERAVV